LRILLTGCRGQLGSELARALPALGELIATDRSSLDLFAAASIREVLQRTRPQVIVNAAAYTAVERAESEEALAVQVNAVAPGVLAEEAKRLGSLLVHYSTDYVFDGTKSTPYTEDDTTNPLNAYGRSKLEGENRIAGSGCRYLVFRTSWVYGPRGRNFLRAILQASREKPQLTVVDDQYGAPTSSIAIAQATVRALQGRAAQGLFHMTAGGRTTWFAFARTVLQRAGIATPVVPIGSDQYPAKARRPINSLLDNSRLKQVFDIELPPWEEQLEPVMRQVLQ
jgi:dTDP-4-dehydrorhamnose reductase